MKAVNLSIELKDTFRVRPLFLLTCIAIATLLLLPDALTGQRTTHPLDDSLAINGPLGFLTARRLAPVSPRSWIRFCSGCPMFVPHGTSSRPWKLLLTRTLRMVKYGLGNTVEFGVRRLDRRFSVLASPWTSGGKSVLNPRQQRYPIPHSVGAM
jgi:hypothetical protein